MNKLELFKGNLRKEIIINKIKYLFVNSNSDYWFYNRCFKSLSDKPSESEYGEEFGQKYRILIDGETFTKNDEVLFVNHLFNLEEDIKLGSKSLSLRYLSKIIELNIFSDEILQLNNMLNLLAECISDEKTLFEGIDLNQKTIPKLINMSILYDNYRANSFDLDYDDILLFQLDLITKIKNYDKRVWIIIELFELTERLKKCIDSLINVNVIILFFKTNLQLDFNNLYFDDIDLENDENLYERMVSMSNYYDIREYKNYLKNSLKLKNTR